MGILQQNLAAGAFHNSDERFDPPKCHPRTCETIISKIMEWVRTLDAERLASFMWLYGPAGSGKSAIAPTIAEMCHNAGLLSASFFFSRNATGRNDKTRFVATLAYQLALCIPELCEGVDRALDHDLLLLSRSLEAQFLALVVSPLKNMINDGQHAPNGRPLFVIVDGLDECNDPQSQVYILTILSTALKEHHLPFIFLIASRPEYHIRQAFDKEALSASTIRMVLHSSYRPSADIRLFFTDKFVEVKRQHPARTHLDLMWPYEEDIERLVQKSSGQFIYASAVVKYVCSTDIGLRKGWTLSWGLPILETTPLSLS